MNGILPFYTLEVVFIGTPLPCSYTKNKSYKVLEWLTSDYLIIEDDDGRKGTIKVPNKYFRDGTFSKNLKTILK